MTVTTLKIPEEATGLRLCKIVGENLVCCEEVQFTKGHSAVVTTLLRARISGAVGPVGETGDYWADILNKDDDWFETIALDRGSWNSLKNRWMRCRVAA